MNDKLTDNGTATSSARRADAKPKRRTAESTTKSAPARADTARVRKTQGANPDIAKQAQRHTKEAIEAFVAVMQDASAPAAARVAAATQILTWGHGKNAGGESDSGERTVRLAWEG
jgi:hypothetical protein